MPLRIKRNAPVVPSDAPKTETGREPLTVLPGANFVCEHRSENGEITVMPLIGWEVVNGEVHPLPRSMGAGWIVRPMADGDDRLMRTTAARLRPTTPNNSLKGSWYQ